MTFSWNNRFMGFLVICVDRGTLSVQSRYQLPDLVSKKWTFPKSLKLEQGEWTNDSKKKWTFTAEQKAEAVRIVEESGKPVT